MWPISSARCRAVREATCVPTPCKGTFRPLAATWPTSRTDCNGQLTDAFQRRREHLRENGVDLRNTRGVLGPWVSLDPKTERFVGEFAEGANALATRTYRQPFAVPPLA